MFLLYNLMLIDWVFSHIQKIEVDIIVSYIVFLLVGSNCSNENQINFLCSVKAM